ncbi:hypothetical protein HY230_02680 [Candidatus Acetothermia bacterium]|nr:hypothetical protein [Candidatus Acetothermia bacterium]
MNEELEFRACTPYPLDPDHFNALAILPYDLTIKHVRLAMEEFLKFLGFINQQLHVRDIDRLEVMLRPATFSDVVGEFMSSSIPKHCKRLAKNQYHNGHPDLIPAGLYANDSVQYAHEGIEIKASRYSKSWQGHNPEDIWLMVFVFDCNRPKDQSKNLPPKPFRFIEVLAAQLQKSDWKFSGRSDTSRRTPTAQVTESGYCKMKANWIYRDLSLL